jgi:hypothetical protein
MGGKRWRVSSRAMNNPARLRPRCAAAVLRLVGSPGNGRDLKRESYPRRVPAPTRSTDAVRAGAIRKLPCFQDVTVGPPFIPKIRGVSIVV